MLDSVDTCAGSFPANGLREKIAAERTAHRLSALRRGIRVLYSYRGKCHDTYEGELDIDGDMPCGPGDNAGPAG